MTTIENKLALELELLRQIEDGAELDDRDGGRGAAMITDAARELRRLLTEGTARVERQKVERVALVRALDDVYHRLADVEGLSSRSDEILRDVHDLIVDLIPDSEEYRVLVQYTPIER